MAGFGCPPRFDRLWFEYTERFGIDFNTPENAARIAFVETLREVRNQIVHDGSEANPLKPITEIDFTAGMDGYVDTKFSEKYPEYVSGEGLGAAVRVTEELLDKNIHAAIELVGWLSTELYKLNELMGTVDDSLGAGPKSRPYE